jgi:hypothetical protein
VIGAGLSFIGRKSFAGVEKRLFPILTVEKHPIMPSRRNPFAIVEKHSLAVLLVEIHSLKPATGAHLSCDRLVPFRHAARRNVVRVSVDAIKQPVGGLPGKKIGIRFQSSASPRRREPCREIPELEVAQDLFDDGSVFDEADDP